MKKNLKNVDNWDELWVFSRFHSVGSFENFDGVWFDKYNIPYKFRLISYGEFHKEGYWAGLLNRKFEE